MFRLVTATAVIVVRQALDTAERFFPGDVKPRLRHKIRREDVGAIAVVAAMQGGGAWQALRESADIRATAKLSSSKPRQLIKAIVEAHWKKKRARPRDVEAEDSDTGSDRGSGSPDPTVTRNRTTTRPSVPLANKRRRRGS